jgi:protein-disulfide isomerase
MENSTGNSNLLIPISIVVAGLIVAGAFFISKDDNGGEEENNQEEEQEQQINIKPVSGDDHILGNPNADIVVVEFSDLECPYCKNFHETMHQIVDEFGKDGEVAWVYRHLPLTRLHSKAQREAEATECAWAQGGNDAWWAYIDRLFEVTPSNNGLDLNQLPVIAEEVGLDVEEFEQCLEDETYKDKVRADSDDAIASGGQGTPYNVFLIKGEDPIPVSGGLPFDQMKNLIEQTLLTF